MRLEPGFLSSAGCGPAQRLLPFYVNGSLEGDEAEVVRAHLERCAACRREMAFLLPLARAVETHGVAVSAALAVAPVDPAAERRAARADNGSRGFWIAAAAVVVLIAGSLWPYLRPVGGPPDRAGSYVLDLGNGPERGDEQLPVLASRLGDRALTLVFFVPVRPDARYAADLLDARGQALAHADEVGPPDALGRISWTVPPRVLHATGEHEVAISTTDESGDRRIYRYTFRVDSPPDEDD